MKFNTIINSIILAVAVVFLAALAFRVKTGTAADSIAVLKTTGMTCGSCSSKISTSLESVKGVAVTEVDVEGGWVVVGYDTKSTKPDAIASKVNEAGFSSSVYRVLTPEQFKQMTGRDIGKKASTSGCCGGKGGCGSNKKS
jgi:copper chaperone CopZ